MSRKYLVSPSILSADFANLEKEIEAVIAAGADWIHVDVMDGHFVPNITIGAPVVKSLSQVTNAPLDVHLMIENPEKYIEDFARAGAQYLTFHVEATQDPKALVQQIRQLGVRPGITMKPATPLEPYLPLIKDVDLVLIMTVNPGFSGQKFMPEQVQKIKQLRSYIKQHNLSALIEVDGGINDITVELCREADVFVAGHFVFKNEYREAVAKLKGIGWNSQDKT